MVKSQDTELGLWHDLKYPIECEFLSVVSFGIGSEFYFLHYKSNPCSL